MPPLTVVKFGAVTGELTLVKASPPKPGYICEDRNGAGDPSGKPDLEAMLEGVVQIVYPHCDRDNRLPRVRLRNAPPCGACRGVLFERRPEPLDGERRFQKHARHNDIPLSALFHATWSAESETLQSAFE
jgi:hypothetical protein